MLTKKAKYGLKAMIDLSRQGGRSTFVADVAGRNGIPKKFLDAILGDLRNAGMLWSKKGKSGGYLLARPPEEISVGAVLRALDGPLAPIACASRSAFAPCQDCVDLESCEVRLVMLDVRDAMAEVLDRLTLAEVRELGADDPASFVYQI
jgi:Rrf2 family protein